MGAPYVFFHKTRNTILKDLVEGTTVHYRLTWDKKTDKWMAINTSLQKGGTTEHQMHTIARGAGSDSSNHWNANWREEQANHHQRQTQWRTGGRQGAENVEGGKGTESWGDDSNAPQTHQTGDAGGIQPPPGRQQQHTKNAPCKFFARGACKNGDSCTWRHDLVRAEGQKGGWVSYGKGATQVTATRHAIMVAETRNAVKRDMEQERWNYHLHPTSNCPPFLLPNAERNEDGTTGHYARIQAWTENRNEVLNRANTLDEQNIMKPYSEDQTLDELDLQRTKMRRLEFVCDRNRVQSQSSAETINNQQVEVSARTGFWEGFQNFWATDWMQFFNQEEQREHAIWMVGQQIGANPEQLCPPKVGGNCTFSHTMGGVQQQLAPATRTEFTTTDPRELIDINQKGLAPSQRGWKEELAPKFCTPEGYATLGEVDPTRSKYPPRTLQFRPNISKKARERGAPLKHLRSLFEQFKFGELLPDPVDSKEITIIYPSHSIVRKNAGNKSGYLLFFGRVHELLHRLLLEETHHTLSRENARTQGGVR